jgi:1,4-dihydroxy-6-naphthoate synthase
MSREKTLRIAYTPDSDDAFYYFALETGRLTLRGFRLLFERRPMSFLNQAALSGQFPITAISSVAYPAVAYRYAILSVGTSVGRGYGPVLVGRRFTRPEELSGKRVGVPGIPTTGWLLLRWLCPDAIVVELPFDEIGAAVVRGDLDAGVMIHEELLYYPRLGLQRVADLGAEWCRHHDLPLPVGLNVIRRDLGRAAMELLCSTIRRSLTFALENREEALAWVSRFGRGVEGQCTRPFVEMFANGDSLRMPDDVRRALGVLLRQAVDLGVGDRVPDLDIVEGQNLTSKGNQPWIERSVCSR